MEVWVVEEPWGISAELFPRDLDFLVCVCVWFIWHNEDDAPQNRGIRCVGRDDNKALLVITVVV